MSTTDGPYGEQPRTGGAVTMGGPPMPNPTAAPGMAPGPGQEFAGYPPYGGWGYGRMAPRRQYPIETKPFFLTSEFGGVVVAIVALLITAAANDSVDARLFWILTTALVSAYLLSRGIAKSGTKSRSFDPREQLLSPERHGQGQQQ